MDNTMVCVFPWELALLSHIHNQDVREVTIDQMIALGDGVMKVERQKLIRHPKLKAALPPDPKEQYLLMQYVDPEQDPCNDPDGEYGRMIEKYGMDKEMPVPVVERVLGQAPSFAAYIKQFAEDRIPMPSLAFAAAHDLPKPIEKMTVAELRAALTERDTPWDVKDSAAALRAKLGEALATA